MKPIAMYEDVGYKFGEWLDVAWFALRLNDPSATPSEPIPFRLDSTLIPPPVALGEELGLALTLRAAIHPGVSVGRDGFQAATLGKQQQGPLNAPWAGIREDRVAS